MTILQQPDALSFSMNLKPFKISATADVVFSLSQGDAVLLSQILSPNADGQVEISLRDVIHDRLSCQVPPTADPYQQSSVAADFTAVIDGQSVTFRVIRGGVDRLSGTVNDFLRANFLTWQPNVKPVTYSSPEFLSYYAVSSGCSLKVKAWFTDASGNATAGATKTICSLTKGVVTTVSVQYAVIAGLYAGSLPAYYDVWVASGSTALTYTQRYYANVMQSEEEQWIFFENSLGGIDTFRTFGAVSLDAEHTHHIAEIDDVAYEYRVDTERKWTVNTGHLDILERRWLLDFFPSAGKYVYAGSAVRRIVLTEDSVSYRFRELPSSYSFTFRFAEALPLLNLPRHELPVEMLDITVPDIGSFTLPPRLLEFSRLPLSEGVLFPVQSPYAEEWGVATLAGIAQYVSSLIDIPSPGISRNDIIRLLSAQLTPLDPLHPEDSLIDPSWLPESYGGTTDISHVAGLQNALDTLTGQLSNKLDVRFFNSIFTVYDSDGNAIVPNTYTQVADNLRILVGTWTDEYLSALGKNPSGGGSGGTGSVNSIKVAANAYLDPDSNGIIDMSGYVVSSADRTRWDAAAAGGHTHSNKSVLDGITAAKISSWDAVASIMGTDSDTVINKWNEVVAFLDTYTEADTLANLLSNKLDVRFFNSIFTVYDSDGNAIVPNTYTQVADNLRILVGTWTDEYLSALGKNPSGGGSGGTGSVNSIKVAANVFRDPDSDGIIDLTADIVSSADRTRWNAASTNSHTHSNKSVLDGITAAKISSWDAVASIMGTDSDTVINKWNEVVAFLDDISEESTLDGLLSAKANSSVTISAGNGLTGGGNLQANRSLSILLQTNSGLVASSSGLKLDIINNLTTNNVYKALSAAQGKALNDRLVILETMFTREGSGTSADPYVIKANYGLYTDDFLSALGKNPSGGGTGGTGSVNSIKIASNTYLDPDEDGIIDMSSYAATWNNKQNTITDLATIRSNASHGNTAYGYFTSGIANNAARLSNTTKIGDTNQPVYFSASGVPVAISYTIGKSVPTNAVFTDTTYKLTLNGTTNGASGGTSLGSFYAPTASGTANQVLISGGSNTAPSWTAQSNLSVGTAAKLGTGTTTYTAWGQTYWSSGVPQSISGNMTSVGSITPSANGNALGTTSARFNIYGTAGNFSGNVSITGTLSVTGATTLTGLLTANGGIVVPSSKTIKIGDCTISWDSTNSMLKFDTGIYSTGAVSALGSNSSGGGSGTFDEEAMWTALGTTSSAKVIASSHIPNLAASKITSGTFAAARIPIATASAVGGIKVGTTLAISDGVLNQKSGIATTGTYRSVTVDTYGRVTAGTNPTTLSGYGITDAYTKTSSDGRFMRISDYTDIGATSSSTVSCNTLTTYGVYKNGSTSTASSYVTDRPVNSAVPFRLVVERSSYASNPYIRQIYQSYNSNVAYERYSTDTGANWSNWVKVQDNLANYALASSLDDYLPLSGGTMTGAVTFKTGTATSTSQGFNLGTTGHVGASSTGVGIYSTGSILLRPSQTLGEAATSVGLSITNTALTYNTYPILHSNNFDSYALPLTGGTLTSYLEIDRSPYGALSLGAQLNVLRARCMNAESGTFAYNNVISLFGSGETGTTVNNLGVRLGSQSGATWISAGESGKTLSSQYTDMCNTESVYITADNQIKFFTNCSNDGTSFVDAATINSSGNLIVKGRVVVGTGGASGSSYVGSDTADSIYLNNSSGAVLVCKGKVVRRTTTISDVTLGESAYPWLAVYATTFHGALSGNATTSSSCTGNAATATKATQDGDGRTITSTYLTAIGRSGDNITQTKGGTTSNVTHILERNETVNFTPNAVGWYRIAQFANTAAHGNSVLLYLNRTYNNGNNESYIFAITTMYSGSVSISQLAGKYNSSNFTKIRVDNPNSGYGYIDVYYGSAKENDAHVTTIGSAYSLSSVTFNPTTVGTLTEFNINGSGMKTDGEFYLSKASQGTMRFVPQGGVNYIQSANDSFGAAADLVFSGPSLAQGSNLINYFDTVTIGQSTAASFGLSVYNTKQRWALHTHTLYNSVRTSFYASYGGGQAMWVGSSSTSTSHYLLAAYKGITGEGSGGSAVMFVRADGCVGIDTSSPSYALHVVGTIYGSGEITAASDARAKNILGNVNLDLKYMADAPNILYEWKNKEQHDDNIHVGSLAQYWLKDKRTKYLVSQDKNNGMYSLNYGALATSMAISIAKEVVKHEDEITRLKKEVVKLRERVEELEERRIA